MSYGGSWGFVWHLQGIFALVLSFGLLMLVIWLAKYADKKTLKKIVQSCLIVGFAGLIIVGLLSLAFGGGYKDRKYSKMFDYEINRNLIKDINEYYLDDNIELDAVDPVVDNES